MISGTCGKFKPEDFEPAFKNKAVKCISIYFPSLKKELQMDELGAKYCVVTNYSEWKP